MNPRLAIRAALLAFSLAALLLAPPPASAATNRLQGRIGFSNVDPEVLAILGSPGQSGLFSFTLEATSFPPAPFSSHRLTEPASDPVSSPWSLEVESAAAGTEYRIVASAQLGQAVVKDDYYFLAVTSPPVLEPPAGPTDFDILECAGIIRVSFVDASGAPVTARGDRITADSSAGGASPLAMIWGAVTGKDVVVRGDGSTYTVRAEITTGTDPFSDRLTQQRTATVPVACDEIVELPFEVATPGAAELGALTGRLDVLGEDEVVSGGSVANARSHVEGTGPWRNLRAALLPGPPSAGTWTLANLVASDVVSPAIPWEIKAEAAFGAGHAAATFTTPSLPFLVGPGELVDAGDLFVIDPVRIEGSVLLAGPPAHPLHGALLQDAWRAADRDLDGNGIPDDFARFFDSTCAIARGRFGVAPGATRSALGAVGMASLQGGWDAASSAFVGSHRIVLGNLEGEPGFYAADELNLKLLDVAAPASPETFVDQRLDIDEPGPAWELPGGGSETADKAYCFSQVTLHVTAPGGAPSYGPSIGGAGSFAGTDFLGRDTAYDATLWWARGVPTSSARAEVGNASTFLLSSGAWTLEPTVIVPQPSGGGVLTALPPLQLDVGCRQALEVSADAQVILETDVPPCAAAGALSLAGRARATAGIASLSWSVNGGPAESLCIACGIDVPFAFDAPLAPGDNVVRVEAVPDAGTPAAAQVHARVSPEATGLRVQREGDALRLSWNAELRDTFAVHAGTIASLQSGAHDHDRVGACDRRGDSATIPLPSTDAYLLVTSACSAGAGSAPGPGPGPAPGSAEGSYGRDSLGRERPESISPCR